MIQLWFRLGLAYDLTGAVAKLRRSYWGEPLKRVFIFAALAIGMSSVSRGQIKSTAAQEEVLRLEKELSQAVVENNAEAVGRLLADDWIIVDPDGGIVDKARFLAVIQSGALTHETMESTDTRVRIYGAAAIVTALTTTTGKYGGQAFTTQERATDVFVKQDGRWRCAISHLTKFTPK